MNRENVNDSTATGTSGRTGEDRFIRETGLAAEIAGIAGPVAESLGFRLVRVLIGGGVDGQTIQIMAERPDGTMAIEDCEAISRDLSAVLDTYDPMPDAYRLEVSSPGIDRPLVRASDFEDWQGYEARVELKEAVSGRKRWRGELEGFEDGEVRMICEIEGQGPQVVGFPISMITEAKLMLTDELVRESLRSNNQDKKQARKQDRSKSARKDNGKPGKTARAQSPGPIKTSE